MSARVPVFVLTVVVLAAGALGACRRAPSAEPPPPRELSQTAYVWQRHWAPGVREAVAQPPAEISGLRVLVAEVAPAARRSALTMIEVDAAALAAARVPVTVVVRIEGARPVAALSLAPVVDAATRLRAAGVTVVGLEVDHDCATARLADYARWLAAQRPQHLAFSITALPTWAGSAALADVARAVDEIVVQVHAVRAPMIFDANAAWRDLVRFAGAVPVPVRVALPTYRARARGLEVDVDPADVAAFVHRLATRPLANVAGIAWFRLPVSGDDQTWSPATFARVVAADRPAPRARLALVAQGERRFDVVATNDTGELADLPPVTIRGRVDAADMVMGYRAVGDGRWEAPRRSLDHHERLVIGWITGEELSLVDQDR